LANRRAVLAGSIFSGGIERSAVRPELTVEGKRTPYGGMQGRRSSKTMSLPNGGVLRDGVVGSHFSSD